jgi:hypothetical protein
MESSQTVLDSSTSAMTVAPKAPAIKPKENGKDAHSIYRLKIRNH